MTGTDLAARILEGRTACNRCGAELSTYSTDTCLFCRKPLCGPCWEAFGDCGHPELVELNRRQAERRRLLRAKGSGRWTIDRLSRYYGLNMEDTGKYLRLFCLGTRRPGDGRLLWLSPQDARRFGEALDVRRRRMNHKILYRPPWPEWLRHLWTEAGYTAPPLKP